MSAPIYSYVPGIDYEATEHTTSDFDYDLPESRIAQTPLIPRDSCKLLVFDRPSGTMTDRVFADIVDLLSPKDVLVVNDTRVLPARLHMRRMSSGGAVELLLLKALEAQSDITQTWECLAKPAKRVRVGDAFEAIDEDETPLLTARVIEEGEMGLRIVELSSWHGRVDDALAYVGKTPLPPYITTELEDGNLYQTVYARDEKSAAAPTAGLHFTDELLARIRDKGVTEATVRLDVGLDTFRPISGEDPLSHRIHTEYISVDQETVDALRAAKERGGRVVAVGTTTARALETAYQATRMNSGEGNQMPDNPDIPHSHPSFNLAPCAGQSGLFITPGYQFGIVDALITNFHVPRSTLMMMVSAFAGRDTIMGAYQYALDHDYRFLSFGDAMLIQ